MHHKVHHTVNMATRLQQSVTRRQTLPLTASDERDLDLIRNSPTYRRAFEDVSGNSTLANAGDLTESALLHAVLEVGLAAIRESALEAGYAELAQHRRPEDRKVQRRRRPSWADED